MTGSKRENLFLFTIALIVAIMLFLHLEDRLNPISRREYAVPLEMKNLKDTCVVTKKPKSIAVIAEGSEDSLDALQPEFLTAWVDLSKSKLGDHFYPVHFRCRIKTDVHLRLKNQSHSIAVEELLKVNKKIQLEERGTISKQFYYDGASLNPQSVDISGAKSNIEKIHKLRAVLNLNTLNGSEITPAPIEALDINNRKISHLRLEPSVTLIHPAITYAPANKRIPINVNWAGSLPAGHKIEKYEIKPSQVTITGKSADLTSIYAVETAPVNLSKIDRSVTKIIPLLAPNGISEINHRYTKISILISKE